MKIDRQAVLARAHRGELYGHFFKSEARDAMPAGTCIMKTVKEPGDMHEVGALGTVIASVGPIPFEGRDEYAYFVVWDDMPTVVVAVVGNRIGEAH